MGILSKIGKKSQKPLAVTSKSKTRGTKPVILPDVSGRMSAQMREIGDLKCDLSKMATALRESMRLNKGTVREIDKLGGFLKTVELNTLSLERLQPENAQLKTRLENLQSDLAKKTVWANEMESKAVAYQARFDEAYAELEICRGHMVEQDERLRDDTAQYSSLNADMDDLQGEKHRLVVRVKDLKAENFVVQKEMLKLKDATAVLARQNTELERQADLFRARIKDEHSHKETVTSGLKTLRLDYSQEKSAHIETLSKLDKARYASTACQNALADMRQRSDDKIFALGATIEGLEALLKVNTEMSRYDASERTKLKTLSERDTRRVEGMAARLGKKTTELDENRLALTGMNANYDALNKKFLNLLSDMESLRGDHHKQSRKLEEYSSITGIAVGQSFYKDKGRTPNLTLVKDQD
ncbi:MAG: hypothetical protein COA69_12235 [Robiginitomaculum sp.]|nr:MAG: hypothetical protein COA69_12235 [Robiginitomaculum sp.]